MAYIRTHDTTVRRGGKPVKRHVVCWREPATDPLTGLPVPGRSRSRQESYASRADAEVRRDELNAARHTGGTARLAEARKLGQESYGAWAARWLESLQVRVEAGTLKARTAEDSASLLRRYVLEAFGHRAIGSITALDAERWLATLLRTPSRQGDHAPLSRATVTHAWKTFSAVMRYALTHKAIAENPASAVDFKTAKATATHAATSAKSDGSSGFEHRPLTPAQVAALSEQVAADGYPIYGLLVTFLAYTGLRAAECAGLEVRDVTIRHGANGSVTGSVQVRRTKDRKKTANGREWVTGTPKSKASRRTVPLEPWLAEEMAAYLTHTHPRADNPTAPLWPSRKNGGGYRAEGTRYVVPLSWDNPVALGTWWDTIVKPALTAIGLPASRPATADSPAVRGVRLHDLRHTFAVICLMAGRHHIQVSKLMGHATRTLVLDVYGDWIPDEDDAGIPLPPPVTRKAAANGHGATVTRLYG